MYIRRNYVDSWNYVIEKANKDFYVTFCTFVGRTSKDSCKRIASLRSTSDSCVTSTKGKLEVVHEHYERLGMRPVDDDRYLERACREENDRV